jgi:ArsR family transcriptional regulator, lead/cadmium/zinc/bismuth-responsive transcriptional repressor
MARRPASGTIRGTVIACCGGAPGRDAPAELCDRPLLSDAQASRVGALFGVLGNETRLRMLHHLVRCGESTVTEVCSALSMKPQAVSNQLRRLADIGIVCCRREGRCVLYRVSNGCVAPLLDLGVCLIEAGGVGGARDDELSNNGSKGAKR